MGQISIKQLEKQKRELESQIQKYYDQQYREQVLKNEQFIGKTYKKQNVDESWSYYKIISCINDAKNNMNTLIFTLPFDIKPLYNGRIDCELCVFDAFGWFCNNYNCSGKKEIDFYTEIPENEFKEKLDEWFLCLKEKCV